MTSLALFRSVCLRAPAAEGAHGVAAPLAKPSVLSAAGAHPAALIQPARRQGASR